MIEKSSNWWHGDFNTFIYGDNIQLGGMVTVQLKKDDKIVEEVKAHDFITPVVKELQSFVQRFVIPFNTEGIYYTSDHVLSPFKLGNGKYFSVYLKDSDAYTDPNDYHNRSQIGNTIGYVSDELYSGSETLRGTINAAESTPTENGVKMVFDWPTHAANGTIRGIQFGQEYNFNIFSVGIPDMSYLGLSFYNGRFYTYNSDNEVFGYFTRTGLWVPLFPRPSAIPYVTGCCFDGQFWYVCCEVTSGDNFFKLDTAGNIVFSAKLSIKPFRIACSSGVLAVKPVLSDTVYEVNPNTGQLTGKSVTLPSQNLYLASWSNNGFIAHITSAFSYNMWFIPLDFSGYFTIGSHDYQITSFGTVDDNNMFVGLYRTSYGVCCLNYYCLGTIFSRVILPQPITKTNVNTLKVIYEFNYY